MWLWGCLMPHPPIIIPEVGRGREGDASITLEGVRNLVDRLGVKKPDFIFVLSPHSTYGAGLHLLQAESYRGDLSMFGASEVKFHLKGVPEKVPLLMRVLFEKIPVEAEASRTAILDHASIVPLYYFAKSWTTMPRILVANPAGLTLDQAFYLGKLLHSFGNGETWGLIASGDLSHRLKPEAPAGYSPNGRTFDNKIVSALKKNDPSGLFEMTSSFIESAGECGLRSVLSLLGLAVEGNTEVLSYEGPFGVGYCTALVIPEKPRYVNLARKAIETYLISGRVLTEEDSRSFMGEKGLPRQAACFVSLKKKDGTLRGCIGTIQPATSCLAKEIITNAISAATRDPRFTPVTIEDLEDIDVSVDILSYPEIVTDRKVLDPQRYGIIVEKGGLRGVLLPHLNGIDTVDEQISIAANKAGIASLENIRISRFTVNRYFEEK